MEDQTPGTAKHLIDSAQSVIIILPPDPTKDMISAGISLHAALKDNGKTSQIGCGSEVNLDSPIKGVSSISDTIGSRNLIISFDYHEDDLDKVDYDVRDDGKFYLLVKPKAGSPVPDVGGVKYSYSGAEADLVITFGIGSLEELGKIYADEKTFLDEAEILSLNTSLRPAAFTSNLFHKNAVSFSELVAVLLWEQKIKISAPVAQILLTNIFESSNNFTNTHLTAITFEVIAYLMRSGAHLPKSQANTQTFTQAPFFEIPQDTIEENIPLPEEENAPVPSDWNKPKIFRVGDDKVQ